MSESNPVTTEAFDLSQFETFSEKVEAAAKLLKKNDKGVYQLPEDVELPEDIRYAVTIEKRRRDTESTLGKTKSTLEALQAEKQALAGRVKVDATASLTEDEREALAQLKHTDPDAWRVQMNQLETVAKQALERELSEAAATASQQQELERRGVVLADFNNAHPDAPITQEVIENDIPPRIIKKLEDGSVSFEEFLEEAYNYLTKPKTVGSAKAPQQPNLGNVGGSSKPRPEAVEADFSSSYKEVTF